MRDSLLADMKLEITKQLDNFLRSEGMVLHVAANDNVPEGEPLVELESIDNETLSGIRLLFEIRVILRILGKPWQCDALVRGVYRVLHPHNLTVCELTVLLMGLHVEDVACETPEVQKKRATLRYVMEEC